MYNSAKVHINDVKFLLNINFKIEFAILIRTPTILFMRINKKKLHVMNYNISILFKKSLTLIQLFILYENN